ncbi:hypothetical protein [Azospirillum sp. ST 5-10]|uniref:hypothetical protein n=1 Tax=unclassified Azospirillum TaxID=2630922 RepID=UPI003F4A5A9C
MKAFASALAFYLVAMVVTGLVFDDLITVPSSDAYSLGSVRVGDDGSEGRAGWGGEP